MVALLQFSASRKSADIVLVRLHGPSVVSCNFLKGNSVDFGLIVSGFFSLRQEKIMMVDANNKQDGE